MRWSLEHLRSDTCTEKYISNRGMTRPIKLVGLELTVVLKKIKKKLHSMEVEGKFNGLQHTFSFLVYFSFAKQT